MNEYFKSIILDLKLDESSVKETEKSLQKMSKFNLIDEKSAKALNKQLDDYTKKQAAIAKIQKDIATLQKLNTKESKQAVSALEEQLSTLTDKESGLAGANFASTLSGIATSFLAKLAGVFKDTLSEMKDMLEYSQLSNARTRELAFGYGLSSSQAYGMQTAMSMVGISSEEDLMYMNAQETRQFREAFEKYSSYYEDLAASGYFKQLQEYQFEMQDFKMEMQQEIIGFFIDNKDMITNSMKMIIKAGEFIVQALGWLLDFFEKDERTSAQRSATTESIINSYSTSTKQTNVKIDNTFNNVAQNDQTWLANAGQMTYDQVVVALGGD